MSRLSLLLLLTLAASPVAAEPGHAIRRCTSPDGSILHTDRACATFNATDRLPPPGSRARTQPASVSSKGVQSSGTAPECPDSPDALVTSLGAAWQSRDVNRVAGLVDWRGAGSGTAHRVLRYLRSALKLPAIDIALEAPPTNVRVDQLDEQGEGDSLRFGLSQDYGCYWLDIAALD